MQTFRLSRLSHPRATLWAAALLTIVFVAFGAVAHVIKPELCNPDHIAVPHNSTGETQTSVDAGLS